MNERCQGAERQASAQDVESSVPDDQSDGERAQEAHQRAEDGEGQHLAHVGGILALVDRGEALVGLQLLGEELDDPHTGDRFLQVRIEPGELAAHFAVGGPDAVSELPCSEYDEREQREEGKGKPPLEPKHDDENADHEKGVAEQVDEHGCEHLVDRVDVVRRPGDQPTDGRPVEVAEGKL